MANTERIKAMKEKLLAMPHIPRFGHEGDVVDRDGKPLTEGAKALAAKKQIVPVK